MNPSTPVEDGPMSAHERIYLLLAGIFIAALVVTNIIAAKAFVLPIFGRELIYSVAIVPYPITFLVTDIVSEIYGRRRANYIVIVGFVVSLFTLGVITAGRYLPIWENSAVSQANYDALFRYAPRILFASMVAYLVAQFVDIRIFHFWKRLTEGRHLWLRNNASTMVSQLVDTTLVVVLTHYGTVSQESGEPYAFAQFRKMIISGYLLKAGIALLDTPLFYLSVWIFRNKLPPVPWQRAPGA